MAKSLVATNSSKVPLKSKQCVMRAGNGSLTLFLFEGINTEIVEIVTDDDLVHALLRHVAGLIDKPAKLCKAPRSVVSARRAFMQMRLVDEGDLIVTPTIQYDAHTYYLVEVDVEGGFADQAEFEVTIAGEVFCEGTLRDGEYDCRGI